MDDTVLHELRASSSDEAFDEKFVAAGLLKARQKSIEVMHEIRHLIEEGMTEDDARVLALNVFRNHGVLKHWHKPYIRFGAGTALTFHEPLQKEYRLKKNDPFYIDLGPVWPDLEGSLFYEGDVGDTFIFGENKQAEHCAQTARLLFNEGQAYWHENSCSGKELYRFLKEKSEHYGYELAKSVEGHRLSDFPHHQYSRKVLAEIDFLPSPTLWVLEIQLIERTKKFGAFFEDMLISP